MSEEEQQLDWLAEQCCQVLEKTVSKEWTDRKRERLIGEDRMGVLVWMNTLDTDNIRDIANHLNIAASDLDTTVRTARSL